MDYMISKLARELIEAEKAQNAMNGDETPEQAWRIDNAVYNTRDAFLKAATPKAWLEMCDNLSAFGD